MWNMVFGRWQIGRLLVNDDVTGSGFKRFRSLHGVIVECIQHCLDSRRVPGRMVNEKQCSYKRILANEIKGGQQSSLMWKLLTGVLPETLNMWN